MLNLLAEIEPRGTGANTGALLGGVALLMLWILVVAVQILRHRRRRTALAQEAPTVHNETSRAPVQPTEGR